MEMRAKNISSLFVWVALVGFALGSVSIMNVSPAFAAKAEKAIVDLNSASVKELEALPGVGAATAKKIVANRPYKSVEGLSKAGLSAKKIEVLKPLVTVGSATPPKEAATKATAPPAPAKVTSEKTAPSSGKQPSPAAVKLAPGEKVNINTASQQQLEALPGIGPAKAKAIMDGRPYGKIEDIMKVKGIKQGVFNKIKDLITVK